MYVARYTKNAEGDAQRGWSGWGCGYWSTLQDFASEWLEATLFEAYDVSSVYDLTDEQIEQINPYEMAFDEQFQSWRIFHHDGLSCWALYAETPEEAVAEARDLEAASEIGNGGFGYAASGNLRVVAQVHADLWIFECDYVTEEDELGA